MTPAPEPSRPDDDAAGRNFETALEQLADIVARLESGGLGLSESIDAYERGVALVRRLHEELAATEERVSVLVRIDEEGRPILDASAAQPADSTPPATSTRPPRPRGRNQRPRSLPGMDEDPGDA